MFTKLLIIGAVGTSAIGTGAVTGVTPTGMEFAAGPIRIEVGRVEAENGKFFSAHMAEHTPLTFTVNLQGERKLHIKF